MELLSESSSYLVGAFETDGNGVTVQGARIRSTQCDEVAVVVRLKAGAGATSAQQATITVEEHTASSGGTTQTLTQEQQLTKFDTTLSSGTGKLARTKLATPASTYQTLVADGNKQGIVILPMRTRRHTQGFGFMSAKVTGLTAARIVAIDYIRFGEQYGADIALSSLYS